MPIEIKGLFLLLLLWSFAGCKSNPYTQGQNLYNYHCSGCHMEDGSGLVQLIPPIDSSTLSHLGPRGLVCLIRHGLPMDSLTRQQMPGNLILNEVEVANLVNYLGHHYLSVPQWVRWDEIPVMYTACHSR